MTVEGHKVLIAMDISGSTGGNKFYHKTSKEIIDKYPNADLLLWDTRSITGDRAKQDVIRINQNCIGGGGTDPVLIAKHIIQTNFHGDLIIISDGQVGTHDIDKVENVLNKNANWKFNNVECHLIEMTRSGNINMSISCPFTRESTSDVRVYKNEIQVENNVVSIDDIRVFNDIDTINTLEQFQANSTILERCIVAKTMGLTSVTSLRDSLLAMKKRIIKNISNTNTKSNSVTYLINALNNCNIDNAIIAGKAINNEYYSGHEDDWAKQISKFVSMCEGGMRDVFDANIDRIRRQNVQDVVKSESAPIIEENYGGDFKCPILYENESSVILLVKSGVPILQDLEKFIVNDLIDCPLNIFKYPEVLDKFKNRLDHPISLESYKEYDHNTSNYDNYSDDSFEEDHNIKSPLSRDNIQGGICLSENPEHIKATAWTLAHMLTGNKLVGNQDLWFAVILLLVQRNHIEYLKPILPQLQAQMKYRMINRKTFISLTGHPEFPTTLVPLGTAIWYIFASPLFNIDPRRDILRTHLPHLNELRDLIDLIGYKIPDEVNLHVLRLRCMLVMLSAVKKELSSTFWINDGITPVTQNKSYHIRGTLKHLALALVQNSVVINPTNINQSSTETAVRFIPIDGTPSDQQIELVYSKLMFYFRDIRKLDPSTIYSLSLMVDASKSAGDISLPLTWKPTPYVPLKNWVEVKSNDIPIPICLKTCRPFYKVKSDITSSLITWSERVEEVFHCKSTDIISINNMINRFTERYHQYPNSDELILYIYNRLVVNGSKTTLTFYIKDDVAHILSDYTDIMASIPVSEFLNKIDASRNRDERMRIES